MSPCQGRALRPFAAARLAGGRRKLGAVAVVAVVALVALPVTAPGAAGPRTASDGPDYAFPGELALPWACGPALEIVRDWTGHRTAGFSLDLAPPAGELPRPVVVVAPADATVGAAGPDVDYGHHVELDVGHGWHVILAHLAHPPHLGVGAAVRTGDPVGTLGASGAATEPHLHVELLPADRRAADPDRVERVFGRERDAFRALDGPVRIEHPCPAVAGAPLPGNLDRAA